MFIVYSGRAGICSFATKRSERLESSQPLITKCERSKHKANRDAGPPSHAFTRAIVAVLLSIQAIIVDEARKSVPTLLSNAAKYSKDLFISRVLAIFKSTCSWLLLQNCAVTSAVKTAREVGLHDKSSVKEA
jgi:hypothetical protein